MSTSSSYLCVAYGGECGICPPGHTMESLRKAIEVGATALYVEVRVTSDSEVIVWPAVQRLVVANPVSLSDHTLSEWRDLTEEFGPPVVSLDDVLALSKATGTGLFLDVRVPNQENALAKKLRTSGIDLDHVTVTSPSDLVRTILRSLDRKIRIGHRFLNDTHAKLTPTLLKELDAEAVIWPASLLNAPITAVLKNAGIMVYGGPVLLVQEMRRLRDECGVDGVITPNPDLYIASTKGAQPVHAPIILAA